jgi:soluble lytic murein transglycosylase-like protein
MRSVPHVLLAFGLALLVPVALAETTIYVYVDEMGTPHFTDAPTKPYYRPLPAFGLPRGVNLVRGQYAELINQIALEEGVDPGLVRAIAKAESNFNPRAVSRKGAQGLMQLMPGTAGRYAVANSFDPEANIRGGVRYLRFLQDMFPSQLSLALAAYNAGENVVLRYNGIPPYPETREYVRRVLRFYGTPDSALASTPGRASSQRSRTEAIQPPSSPQMVYRRLDVNGVPLYTDVPPLVRSSPGSTR